MRQTLDQCNAECSSVSTSNFLPTRLIDIGNSDQSESICLIEPADTQLQPPSRYAALSYCWGTKEQATRQLTTTSETLSKRLDNISFAEMTPVMQDMVRTARALSIRYIWVDALCILQDDLGDWTREAGCMGSVYANAFVTICAISTSSCLDSFLDRTVRSVSVAFRSSLQPDIHGYLHLRPWRRPIQAKPRELMPGSRTIDLDRGAWHLRAWTLQEEEMSKRLLCFGAERVHFSCPTQTITEMEHGSSKPATIFSHRLRRYEEGDSGEHVRREWHNLLVSYVYRQSTKSTDRFPAIAGLAKSMAEATKWTYVAGLWKESLLEELLWFSYFKYVTKQKLVERLSTRSSDTDIGPSWSWTHCDTIGFREFNSSRCRSSLSGIFREVDFRSECSYSQATCTPDGTDANPYGRPRNSRLNIGGKVIQQDMRWTVRLVSILLVTYGNTEAVCHVDWDDNYPDGKEGVSSFSLLLIASNYGPEYLHAIEAWEASGDSSRVLEYDENGNMTDDSVRACEIPSNRNAYGLVLHPIDNGASYVRVGMFRAGNVGALLPFMDRPFEDVEIV
jgi:hypothetical protein